MNIWGVIIFQFSVCWTSMSEDVSLLLWWSLSLCLNEKGQEEETELNGSLLKQIKQNEVKLCQSIKSIKVFAYFIDLVQQQCHTWHENDL